MLLPTCRVCMLQNQLHILWSNADPAATSFTIQVFNGSVDGAPTVPDNATTALVR